MRRAPNVEAAAGIATAAAAADGDDDVAADVAVGVGVGVVVVVDGDDRRDPFPSGVRCSTGVTKKGSEGNRVSILKIQKYLIPLQTYPLVCTMNAIGAADVRLRGTGGCRCR